MDSPLVQCREEDGYQKKLATLLAEVDRCPKVPRALAGDLLALSEDLGRLYFILNGFYSSRELHFDARVWERQRCFAGWENVDLFSMRIFDRRKWYCVFPG